MIEGLSHITFVVSDLERMATFLSHIFDAEQIYSSGDETFSISHEKHFRVDDIWIAIMEGKPLPEKTYNHVAFKVSDAEFDVYTDRVRSLGVEIHEGRSRVEGESKSLYFYDYDNHLFEIHSGTLEERLERYARGANSNQPVKEWQN